MTMNHKNVWGNFDKNSSELPHAVKVTPTIIVAPVDGSDDGKGLMSLLC